jgi:hypothetical protein
MIRKGGPREFKQKPLKLGSSALSPFFERFLFLAGPEGLNKKTSKFGLDE